jgi:hypothetical protein
LEASFAGWRDFKPARKSFLGGVTGLDFAAGTPRLVSFANLDATGLAVAGDRAASVFGGGVGGLTGVEAGASLAAGSITSFGVSGSFGVGGSGSDGLGSSFLANKGFGANAGVGAGADGSSGSLSTFFGSALSSLLGDSGLLRRPTGFN